MTDFNFDELVGKALDARVAAAAGKILEATPFIAKLGYTDYDSLNPTPVSGANVEVPWRKWHGPPDDVMHRVWIIWDDADYYGPDFHSLYLDDELATMNLVILNSKPGADYRLQGYRGNGPV